MSGAVTSGPDTMRLARDERADFADFLDTLTPEQWDGPTLCTRWRVRDVVAHVVSYEELSTVGLVRRFVRAGWRRTGSTPSACGTTPTAAPSSSWP
jgi:uncharacterized protein (TIGR03083 family)